MVKKQILITVFSFIGFVQLLVSQSTITVKPYLQDVSPHSVHVLWETDFGEESVVEWGLTDSLGNTNLGGAYPADNGEEMIHEVLIEDLDRFTKYFYQVKTDSTVSEIYSFKTPPFASDNESFRIVAMSDMQRDGDFPNKFQEIVEDGVIDYLKEEFGGDLIDNLALIMVPGDLVQSGPNFSSWKNTFFQPAEKILSNVPVYPVLGNHEANTEYYFRYFKLPENGSDGFEEHWWYKDYGNVRIIGLNSNSPFDGEEQLGWLDSLLTTSCSADSIDFVFAQLHHPHKSELWTPGESDFTGEVIERLETFTTDCGKPSIHFFGHTHGYSRGQSRDHKHLWINVASAGGAIDNWGEFPQFDYEEFSVSQDEYGFVLVEVDNENNPSIRIKRISRGDQDSTVDNEIMDSLTIRLTPTFVETPEPLFPKDEEIAPECVLLKAGDFSSPNLGSKHGQSHWQLDTINGDFSTPIVESWKNFENWYFDKNTQAEDDLTDEKILGLEELTSYQWRVRYRDREMNWSNWSTPAEFTTSSSVTLPNLLVNPSAEDALNGWTVIEGIVESNESNVCNGIPAFKGDYYFSIGGICDHSEVGIAEQVVNVNEYKDSIDNGGFLVNFGGYLSNYNGSDQPEIKLIYLDQENEFVDESSVLTTLNNSWTMMIAEEVIPVGTRSIKVELKGTRNAGTDNDSYMDELFLRIGPKIDCDSLVSSTTNLNLVYRSMEVFPNPSSHFAHVELPVNWGNSIQVRITDVVGKKITASYEILSNRIKIDTQDMEEGTYVVQLLSNIHRNRRIGKLIVVKER